MVLVMKVSSRMPKQYLVFQILTTDSLRPSVGMYKMAGCRRRILQTFSAKEPSFSSQVFSTSLVMSYVHNLFAREPL